MSAEQDLIDSLQQAGIFTAGVVDISEAISTMVSEGAGGTLVEYTGTGRELDSSDNGNVIRCTNVGAVSMTVPAGLPTGFSCVIIQGGGLVTAVQGAGATLLANPALVTDGTESELLVVPSGTNAYTIYSPVASSGTLAGLTDIATYDLGAGNTSVAAIKATADAALAAGTTLCLISGTRGTGNTLTATIASGYTGTFQWQSLVAAVWTNVVSGGTSSTHVELVGDLHRDIRCVFTPTNYTTNTLVQPAPVFSAHTPPDGNVAAAYSYSYVAAGAASYAVSSGALPAGLSLNTSTGAITGTPTTAAVYAFTISATNSGGTTSAGSESVTIGAAIAAGSISYVATLSPTGVNFTTGAYDDWLMDHGTSAGTEHRKGVPATSTVSLIGISGVNLSYPGWGHGAPLAANSCDVGDSFDAGGHVSAPFGHDQVGAGDAKLQLTFPAAAVTHHAYLYFQPDGSDFMTLRLTLSDGSASPVVITVPAQGGEVSRLYTITYNSAGSGTLQASLETGAGLSTHAYFLFEAAAYKAS